MNISTIPILLYHKIIPDDFLGNCSDSAVFVSQFKLQMQFLHDHGYRCLSLEQLCRASEGNAHSHKKTFVLTFDDGHESLLQTAYPILQQYRFTATMFLVTEYFNDGKDEETEGNRSLSWRQVENLSKGGISFGSHTCTHPHLLRLSCEQIRYELAISKVYLETRLNREVPILAYPYGESNHEIQKIAMQVGYMAACGVSTGECNRFNLPRISIRSNDTLRTFDFKLTQYYRYLMQLRRWLRQNPILQHFLQVVRPQLHGYYI